MIVASKPSKQERVRFLEAVANCEGCNRSAGSTAWVEVKTAKALIKDGLAIPYDHDLPARDNPRPPTDPAEKLAAREAGGGGAGGE